MDKLETARKNARRVRKVVKEGNPEKKIYKLNPYTNVDELLDAIDRLGKDG
ncbi:MAG: hypothetical protein GY765_36525 [bacterium]|nr:hypothetical protein [bacterium]